MNIIRWNNYSLVLTILLSLNYKLAINLTNTTIQKIIRTRTSVISNPRYVIRKSYEVYSFRNNIQSKNKLQSKLWAKGINIVGMIEIHIKECKNPKCYCK